LKYPKSVAELARLAHEAGFSVIGEAVAHSRPGLTGILMCGLSAGLFFALVTRIYQARVEAKR
jgi:hypothetical protein